jgi:predicted phage-related endonuclease
MKKLNLIQGSAEWLAVRLTHFTASEAPAMMGVSKHISRTQLLDHKKGWTTEVDAFTQKLFDKGHAVEEMARPIAEEFSDEDLVPVVGVLEGTLYLASFDGFSMLGDIGFEHKLYNKVLAENVSNNTLGPEHYLQLEHQLLVGEMDMVLFVCSDGTKDNFYSTWYESVPERRAELIAGWEQFAKDLADHVPQAKAEKVVADVISDLPSISYQMNGLALTSNFGEFIDLSRQVIALSKKPRETDQDFANADRRQKVFIKAEKHIDKVCEDALSEAADISKFIKELRETQVELRKARLDEAKDIKAEKEAKRSKILSHAQVQIREHESIFIKLGVVAPASSISVIEAMKGKQMIDSLQDAADTAVSQIKTELDKWFHIVNENAGFMQDYKEFRFLFADWKDIAFKANDDFQAMVKIRVAEHKQVEADKAEVLRAQIQREEEAKAQAKVEADKAEVLRLERENKAKEEAKIAEEKRQTLEQVNEIARRALEVDRLKQVKIEEEAHAENNRLKRVESEGAYERNISEERLEQRTGAKHKQTVVNVAKAENGNREPRETFMRAPSKMSKPVVKQQAKAVPLTEYQQGYIDGLTAFAEWKGDKQFVGNSGITLQVAVFSFLNKTAA